MMKHALIVVFLSVAGGGCMESKKGVVDAVTREDSPRLLVEWRRYNQSGDDPQETRFYVDNRYAGMGANGFRQVLDKIKSLPRGATVELSWEEPYRGGGSFGYSLPHVLLGFDDDLNEVVRARDLNLVRDYTVYGVP